MELNKPQKPKPKININMNIQQQSNQINMAQNVQMPQQFQQQQNIQMPPMQQMSNLDPFENCNVVQMGGPSQFFGFDSGSEGIKLLKEKQKDKKVAAIIVSFSNGASYDDLFRTVQQKTMEGTQVLVYGCGAKSVQEIYDGLREKQCSKIVKQMLQNIREVHPDCVVFNWECSSSYGGQSFPEGRQTVFGFLRMILDAGHMAMFSDFSLKALIAQWDQKLLGSNPFIKTGQTSGDVELRFKSSVLKECPSAQLQIVGDMAQGGRCNLHTISSTIVYSVNPQKIDKQAYKLSVLTIKSKSQNLPEVLPYPLEIDGHEGSAGHVLLTYKNGGCLLTSMGHWIQLMKVDTSEKKLFEIAEREYGKAYAENMKMEYAQMDMQSQQAYIRSNAVNFIQNQAPCSNMNKKGY